jgi:isoaspartyl peptidase/L-asparaginase-like protein (Ntn-hydrolase superfamily)
MRWLFAGLAACATPYDDPLVPPAQPVVYRKADCPSVPRIVIQRPSGDLEPPKLETLVSGVVGGALVVTHGGAGSSPDVADGPQAGAARALGMLAKDGAEATALDAAIEAVAMLEDDPRFNAGTGSNIRLDGETIQMDASLMTGDGDFAAVAVIERVKNPIRVARLVLDSPHVLLAGEGATRFAHRLGVPDEIPYSEEAKKKYEQRMVELEALMKKPGKKIDWRDYWNFPGEVPDAMKRWAEGGDTVGAVARDRENGFAATLSTGGTSVTLYGRVGDVPVYGAGLFAGSYGAVACTGSGEHIIEAALARTIYLAIEAGTPAKDALARAVRDFPDEVPIGVIAVDRLSYAIASNRAMAYGVAEEERPAE